MSDFLRFVDELCKRTKIHVEIYYSSVCDWCIKIWKRGCANGYPNSSRDGDDAIMCDVSDCDMELCFAKAHVALKEWLSENEGGY